MSENSSEVKEKALSAEELNSLSEHRVRGKDEPPDPKYLLEVRHLCKYFPLGANFFGKPTSYLRAVDDISFGIERGKTIGVVGESGCGKTTLGRTILRLYDITSGQVFFDGKDLAKVPPKELRKMRVDMQLIFQDPYSSLPPRMTVGAIISEAVKVHHIVPKDKVNEHVLNIMKMCGLQPQYYDRYPHEFSGGQRQRVALGRAIIRNPEVFLFDEPLSNLDAKMRATMRTEITKLHNRLQTTFIYVTHDQVEAMTMGTKIVVLKDGVVQQYDTPANIYNRPANKFVAGFIGTPQMNFIDAKYLDSQLTIGSKTIDLTKEFLANQDVESLGGNNVCVGIRPRSVKVMDQEGYDEKYAFEGTVNVSEQLGDEVLLYLTVEGKDGDFTIAGNPKKQYKIGDKVKFSINPNEIHLFNPVTEKTLYISK